MKLVPFFALAALFAAALAFTAVANSYYVFVMATLALMAITGMGLNVLLGLTGQVSFGHVAFYALGAYGVAVSTTMLITPSSRPFSNGCKPLWTCASSTWPGMT